MSVSSGVKFEVRTLSTLSSATMKMAISCVTAVLPVNLDVFGPWREAGVSGRTVASKENMQTSNRKKTNNKQIF